MEYKNISEKDLILIGYGLVKSGQIIKTKKPINNAHFEEISRKIEEKSQKEEDKSINKEK